MIKCSNGHEIVDETPDTPLEKRRLCPRCGSHDRQFSMRLREEVKALDDPYNTVVVDSAQGRGIEEACRLYYQRKFNSRNPANLGYDEVLGKLTPELSASELQDLQDIATITDNLAHGNGFGAMNQMKKICTRKAIALPINDIVKGNGIHSLGDIMNLLEKRQSGEFKPLEVTMHSDMLDGNFVWTRTCREAYLKLCNEFRRIL